MAAVIDLVSPPKSPSSLQSDILYEIVNGEWREIPYMGAWAGSLASILSQFLGAFALPHKLGLAFVEVPFQLKPNRPTRRPDVVFIRYERWPIASPPTEDPAAWQIVPNLAVEVVSPTNTAHEIDEKIEEYFDAGVELVWVIYPLSQRIYIYDSSTSVRILTEKDELDGGAVLPGFRLKIADLFAALVKPQ